MRNNNFVHKHIPNRVLRFFYKLYLYLNVNYVYGLKYKYIYSLTSYLHKKIISFSLKYGNTLTKYFNIVASFFIRVFCLLFTLIRKNKSSAFFFYISLFNVETAFVFIKSLVRLLSNFFKTIVDNLNYAYTKYSAIKNRAVMQTIGQYTESKPFLINPLFHRRIDKYLLGLVIGIEKNSFVFDRLVVQMFFLRDRNVSAILMNSIQRFSPLRATISVFSIVTYFVFYVFSLVISSFFVLFYRVVIRNLLFILSYTLDFFSIFFRVLVKKNNPKYKNSVRGLFYYVFYVYNLFSKFVFSFNFKNMVDSSIRFLEFVAEHSGDLFYDRGNYWLNLKRLENFYRFHYIAPSKKGIADSFPGRNSDYLLDQGKAGVFNFNYDDGLHEDEENEESFSYVDNHQVTREEEMEYAILSLLYRYGIFTTTLLNNLLRIPMIVFISLVSDLSFFRAWLIAFLRGIGKWAAEFDMELMKRTTNPYLRAHFDTFDMWCPYNTVGVIMRNKIYLTFILCLLFIDSVLSYDGWFFPFDKQVIVFRGIPYSPLLFICLVMWALVLLIAQDRLEGEPEDKVVANFATYEEEDTYSKEFENYLDYRYSLFYNIILANYYMGYILYSNNHVLFLWRTEEIKKLKKLGYRNKNMIVDHISLDPLSKVSESYLDQVVLATKTCLKTCIGLIS